MLIPALLLSLSAAPAAAAPARPPARGVVLVLVDTLRRDRLGCYGYSRPTTPNIDALARRAAVFDAAVAASNWTLPSVASLFTSLSVVEHGADAPGLRPDPSAPSLAVAFSSAGWRTALFASSPVFDKDLGLTAGFQDVRVAGSATFEESVGDAERWLEENGRRPFLLVVHAMDPHAPYEPRMPDRHRFGSGRRGIADLLRLDEIFVLAFNRQLPRGLELPASYVQLVDALRADPGAVRHISDHYDDEVAVVDRQVARLLAKLDALGLGRQTAVFLTADHGEELGERGLLGHGTTARDVVLRVPLLAAVPGGKAVRFSEPVSLLDVAPTIAAAAGVPAPSGWRGIALLAPEGKVSPPGRPAFAATDVRGRRLGARAVYSGRWKLSVDEKTGAAELFDLKADPGESRDLAREKPKEAGELSAVLAAWAAQTSARAGRPEPAPSRESAQAALRGLGYLK